MKKLICLLSVLATSSLVGCGTLGFGTYTSTSQSPDAEAAAARGPFGGHRNSNTLDPYKACIQRLQGYIPKAPNDPQYSSYLFQIESLCYSRSQGLGASVAAGIGGYGMGYGPGMGGAPIAILGGPTEGQVVREQMGPQPVVVVDRTNGASQKEVDDLALWVKELDCKVNKTPCKK